MERKKTVSAGGHHLKYKIIKPDIIKNNSRILVFLHEGLGCINKWKDFPDIIARESGMPALVYERYGYGDSEPFKGKRKIDFLHNEALKVLPEMINKLGIDKKLILIGHSDGGSIALMYTSAFPESVDSMILEAPHVCFEEKAKQGLSSALYAWRHKDLRIRLMKYHGANTDAMFWAWHNAWSLPDAPFWNIESFLPGIHSPLLFIQGDNDEYGSIEQFTAIKEKINAPAESYLIPDCGHIPHHQESEKVKKRILEFINK